MERSLPMAGQPVKRGTMAHDHDVYTILVNVASRQQDAAALRRYAPEAERLAARDGHKLYDAIAQRAWGILLRLEGQYDEAEERLNRALSTFAELQTRWQMGWTLSELGELALARADNDAARASFSQALSHFEDIRALPDAERARSALKESFNGSGG